MCIRDKCWVCLGLVERDLYSVLFYICNLLNKLFLGKSGYPFLMITPELRTELKRTFLYYWRKNFCIQNLFISFHAFTLARTWFSPKNCSRKLSFFPIHGRDLGYRHSWLQSLIHIHSVSIMWRSMVTLWIILCYQSPSLFLSPPHNPSKTIQLAVFKALLPLPWLCLTDQIHQIAIPLQPTPSLLTPHVLHSDCIIFTTYNLANISPRYFLFHVTVGSQISTNC